MMTEQDAIISERSGSMQDYADAFARDGAVLIPKLLNQNWLTKLNDAFSELMKTALDMSNYYDDASSRKPGSAAPKAANFTKAENWLHSEDVRAFVFESPIAATAAAVIRSQEIRLFEDLLIFRGAGAAAPTPWHQDSSQNPLSGRQQASVWFSLDPTTRDTGTLRFVAGSHRGPTYIPYVPAAQQGNIERDMRFFDGGPLPEVDDAPELYPTISFDTEPGDVVIFHPQTLHGAFGGAAAHPRRTLSFRLVGDDVRWEPKASIFHDWLRAIPLMRGDKLADAHFPRLWPR